MFRLQRKDKGRLVSTVAIVDCGMGNLFSVQQACQSHGLDSVITGDSHVVDSCDAVILPGVGAFGRAMHVLEELRMPPALKQAAEDGRPLLGICLGMQLLVSRSSEFGSHNGLGIVSGRVDRFDLAPDADGRLPRVPHVGWNRIKKVESFDPQDGAINLLSGIPNGAFMYFVHSYCVKLEDSRLAITTSSYGGKDFCSGFRAGNVVGLQFHPERSGAEGLRVYDNLAGFLRGKEPTGLRGNA